MRVDDLSTEALAAVAALAGKKAFKDAKGHLNLGEHNIDVTLRVTGYVKKGAMGTRTVKNKAVDFAVLFASAVEGLEPEAIEAILERARDENFLDDFDKAGGSVTLHEEVAAGLGVPAYFATPKAGSVSCRGLELSEAFEVIGGGALVETVVPVREEGVA